MHSFLDSKHMAKALRQALAERGEEISHSDALELVARQYSFANWNMLSARIEAAQLKPLDLPSGWHVAGHTNEGNYRRLRLTAELRTEHAETATLWMRVDPAEGRYLHFDNLMQRPGGPLAGTVGWTERQVVLEVPEAAATIHYGFFLRGSGKVWARRFNLEPVGLDVATTEPGPRYLSRPTNLDFGGEQPTA